VAQAVKLVSGDSRSDVRGDEIQHFSGEPASHPHVFDFILILEMYGHYGAFGARRAAAREVWLSRGAAILTGCYHSKNSDPGAGDRLREEGQCGGNGGLRRIGFAC